MLKKWLTYLKEGTTYTVLEICDLQEVRQYFFLEVKQKQNELHVTKEERLSSLNELTTHYKKSSQLLLVLNTKEVLSKRMQAADTTETAALVDAAFPNLNLENFYYQVIQKESVPIVSIIKKQEVTNLLDQLHALKLTPVQLSLGVSGLPAVFSYLEAEEIKVSNKMLFVDEQHIHAIQPLNENLSAKYTFGKLTVPNRFLLGFANVVGYLSRQPQLGNLGELQQKKEFQSKRLFNLGLKAALVFFLGVLLVNYLFFDHYFTKVETLKASLELNNSKIRALRALETSVNTKEERLRLLSSSGNSKATYYLDQLAQKVPLSIRLTKITFQPLEKPLRASKPIALEENELLVAGTSGSGDEFSKWIVTLEKESWISAVQTMDYDYVRGSTSSFLLKISFHEQQP